MNKKFKGILCILGAAFCFSLMSLFIRLSGDLPTMQKTFFRNAFAAVIAFVMLIRSGEGFHIQKGSLPMLFLRSICGAVGMVANFYAIDHMNISDAMMLNKLSPFFAILASAILLREKPNKVEWSCVALAFAGALFVIKPSFQMEAVYGLIGALGGLGAGVAYTFVRMLGMRGERGPVIVLFFSTFSSVIFLPFFILQYHPMTWLQFFFLVMTGVSAAGGQFCITSAYTFAPAKEISVFDYATILFSALWGFCFLGQIPDYLSFLGYAVIIGVAVFKWYYALLQEKKN